MFARDEADFTLEMVYLTESLTEQEHQDLYLSDHFFVMRS